MFEQAQTEMFAGTNLLSILSFTTALCITLAGTAALIRERGSRISLAFFVLAFCLGGWLFGFSLMYRAADADHALRAAKLAYLGLGCLPAAVYTFCAFILQNQERRGRRLAVVWVLGALFTLLSVATDVQVSSVYRYPWSYYPRFTPANIPFLLYFATVMLLAFRDYAEAFRNTARSARGSVRYRRYRILLIAFGIGSLAVLDFLPSFGVWWHPYGSAAILLFSLIAGYSILRYRFMPITPAFAAPEIIEIMNDGLIVLDPDTMVVVVNRATCGLLEYSEQQLVGRRLTDCLDRNRAFAEELESAITSGAGRVELIYHALDDRQRTLSLSISAMRSPMGETLATACVINDITDRKRAEQERDQLIVQLQEANRKLKSVDTMKSNFITMVSHEIRTPLTAIKAFVELLMLKQDLPEEQKMRLMKTVNSETDRLTRLVNDLLDLARIEAGSMKWQIDRISIEQLLLTVITTMGPLFEKKRLTITTNFGSPRSSVFGDRDRLVQVVTNVLGNAVKFTPAAGKIHVAATQEDFPRQVAVSISDSGIGIPAADLERVFEKFHRSNDGQVEGTGLGLAIARQIVEHHGGRIWAASDPGRGSTFTFTLPLA